MPKKYQGSSADLQTGTANRTAKAFVSRHLSRVLEKISPTDPRAEASASHTIDFTRIPSGWTLYEFGQNPVHKLWHMTLVTILDNGDADHVEVSEEDTPVEAFEKCINLALTARKREIQKDEPAKSIVEEGGL